MHPARAGKQNGDASQDEQLTRLRALLMGPELDEVRARLDDPSIRAEETSRVIAEAIALRARRGGELRNALQPAIEEALRISVQRDPHVLADLLFPVIGPAIRKAVASSLSGMMDALNKTMEQSLSARSFGWRLESWRTGKPFGEIVLLRSLLYRVEQVFLIHKKTGLLLGHAAAERATVRDADLISAMLTAIRDFAQDSFAPAEGKEPDRMQFGDFQIWVQHGPQALLACVVQGVPPGEFAGLLGSRLEEVHERMGAALTDFHGDTEPFSAVRPELESCLTGRMAEDRRRVSWMIWAGAGAAALLAAVLAFLYVRDARRWSAYLERLNAEPGIVVARAESSFGRHRVSGLRDPLAADPARLLEGTGLAEERVSARWEAYESADARFQKVRRFEAQKSSVERQAVFFKTASAEVTPDALWAASNEIRLLLAAAQDAGRTVTVEVEGSTDAFGPEAVNAKLGQERAANVAAGLEAQGIPAGRLSAKGGPTPVKDESQGQAQSDWQRRRVGFRVVAAP